MYEHLISHLNVVIYITNKMGVYSTLDRPHLMKIGFPIFIYNFYKTGLFMEAFI